MIICEREFCFSPGLTCYLSLSLSFFFYHLLSLSGLRIKETKEVYEGEVTELTPCETENPMGGYGKTISHVIIGLKTAKGTKQLKVSTFSLSSESLSTVWPWASGITSLCLIFLCVLWVMIHHRAI